VALPKELDQALKTWTHQLQVDAVLDAWSTICDLHGHGDEGEQLARIGPQLVSELIEAVVTVLSMRFMNAVVDQPFLDEAIQFVKDQTYGVEDVAREASYAVRFMGSRREVELYVRNIAFIDLEDYHMMFPFGALGVRKLHGEMPDQEAGDIIEAIRNDLTWNGEEWHIEHERLSDRELLVEVREEYP
jgi:hypothetical protein